MKTLRTGLVLLALGLATAHAQVPPLINYQGRLIDGTNLVNANVGLTLRLYDDPAAGTLLYEDSNTVVVVDGLYSTLLGDDTISGTLTGALASAAVYVEVSINGAALLPRERLVSVGYALGAHDVPGNVFWRTAGNDGTTAGTHFIGTTDEQPLHLRANNATALRLDGEPNPPNLIGGHASNYADPGVNGAFIGGGGDPLGFSMNRVSDHYGVVGGGVYNVAGDGGGTVSNSSFATVAGGAQNSAASPYSAIGGGSVNQIFGAASHSVIAGGYNNIARGTNSAIGGGSLNEARGEASVVAGGSDNESRGRFSSIAGGAGNEATGSFSAVAGGYNNAANGDFSYAAGQSAQSLHHGTFVWADYSSFTLFTSSDSNQFLIRAANGVGINTNGPFTDALTVGGGIRASEAIHAESFVGDGSGLTMLNGSNVNAGTVSNAAFAKGAVTGDKIRDGSISNADVAANTFWETDGNANTTPGSHFLGTTGSSPLDLRANNQRVLRLEGAGTAPNLIGGYTANTVTPSTVIGATIAGGGANGLPNIVADSYGTIGGGANNALRAAYGVISGGRAHVVDTGSTHAAIGGGWHNVIESNTWRATIAGGQDNTIESVSHGATLAGGYMNTIGAYNTSASIGGGYLNEIGVGSSGATIGGGETNRVGDDADLVAIAGGFNNRIEDGADYSSVGGGSANRIGASSWHATIAGGLQNTIGTNRDYAAIGGGQLNLANASGATIAGGGQVDSLIQGNQTEGSGSFIGGGAGNQIGDQSYGTVISGGEQNRIQTNSRHAVIGGGRVNNIRQNAAYSTIAGGAGNFISTNAEASTISGGFANRAEDPGYELTIGGGVSNRAVRRGATVGGGANNIAGGDWSIGYTTVGGGEFNRAMSRYAAVAGGFSNRADGIASAVGGGEFNTADGSDSTVAGGFGNYAGYYLIGYATIGGGFTNSVRESDYGFIGGGRGNAITSGSYAAIGGGAVNRIFSDHTFIGGGGENRIFTNAEYSTIAGGEENIIGTNARNATVGGGWGNLAYGVGSTIAGGGTERSGWAYNVAQGDASTIGGGMGNATGPDALYSLVAGGYNNTANGGGATVAGGVGNEANGDYSFAAGRRAKALHDGAFVWADRQAADFSSVTNDEFAIRATNGVRIARNAGEDRSVPFGVRYGDNSVVAWAKVNEDGSLQNGFNVDASINPSIGVYEIHLKSRATSNTELEPLACIELDSQPTNAATVRFIATDQRGTTNFLVYINSGYFTPTNDEFMVVVFGR